MNHPEWVQKQISAIAKIAKPQWHYADIGACRGEILVILQNIMDKGYSFEADSTNYSVLKEHFTSPSITHVNTAISNLDGEVNFYANTSHEGTILNHDMNFKELTEYVTVSSITLDTYFKDKQLDFVKLDVEGAEWEVFEGARKLLEDREIIWQVEFHLDEHWDKRHFLYDLGYNIYDLDFNKLKVDDPRPYLSFVAKQEL
jgi:FkbM family methyltransferase